MKHIAVASFPDSTPQLLIAPCNPAFIHGAIKNCGVESGNEDTHSRAKRTSYTTHLLRPFVCVVAGQLAAKSHSGCREIRKYLLGIISGWSKKGCRVTRPRGSGLCSPSWGKHEQCLQVGACFVCSYEHDDTPI